MFIVVIPFNLLICAIFAFDPVNLILGYGDLTK